MNSPLERRNPSQSACISDCGLKNITIGIGGAKCSPVGSPLITSTSCHEQPNDAAYMNGGPAELRLAVTGSAHVEAGGKSGDTTATGIMELTIGSCAGPTCTFIISRLLLDAADFSIGGALAHDVHLENRGLVIGAWSKSTKVFSLDPGAMTIDVAFSIDSKTGGIVDISNDLTASGMIASDGSGLTFAGTFSQKKVTVSFNLTGTVTGHPPAADFVPRGPTIECNAFNAANVTFDGTLSHDPDGDLMSYLWSIDNALVGRSSTLAASLSLGGPHLVDLTVVDSRGAKGVSDAAITVQDTIPPALIASVSPACLWPPNHSMVLYEFGAGIDAKATDVCDPSPQINVVAVTSDQPPSGGGQGNQDPDILFGAKSFCVRSERQGTDSAGRHYSATIQAKDASGNTTTKVLTVTVAHDQASAACPKVDPGRIVGEGDPRCTAN